TPVRPTSPEPREPCTLTPTGAVMSYDTRQLTPHVVSMARENPPRGNAPPGWELGCTTRLIWVSVTEGLVRIITSPPSPVTTMSVTLVFSTSLKVSWAPTPPQPVRA